MTLNMMWTGIWGGRKEPGAGQAWVTGARRGWAVIVFGRCWPVPARAGLLGSRHVSLTDASAQRAASCRGQVMGTEQRRVGGRPEKPRAVPRSLPIAVFTPVTRGRFLDVSVKIQD